MGEADNIVLYCTKGEIIESGVKFGNFNSNKIENLLNNFEGNLHSIHDIKLLKLSKQDEGVLNTDVVQLSGDYYLNVRLFFILSIEIKNDKIKIELERKGI